MRKNEGRATAAKAAGAKGRMAGQTAARPAPQAAKARFGGIDGLRALAILGVIAFHTRPSLLQGGFIGVTMFLVITGFLATRTVIAAVDRTGTFGYGRYLLRRLRRIWPMALATIAITPPLAWLLAPSLLVKAISDTLPHALFAGNWTYIFRKVPYFEAAGLPSPLTHLWFLGVVMQFYLVWPLLMLLLCKATRSAWLRSLVVIAIIGASTAAMALLLDPADTARVYYGTDTRLAELAMGALLAIWMAPRADAGKMADPAAASVPPAPPAPGVPAMGVPPAPGTPIAAFMARNGLPPVPPAPAVAARPMPPAPVPAPAAGTASGISSNLLGMASLATLLAAFWFANGYLPAMYRGGYLLAAFACLCALAAATDGGSIWAKVLSCPPLRYIGSRSFSLYMVHYPLLLFMNPANRTTALPWWGWAVQGLIIWAAGEAMYQLVEKPSGPGRGKAGQTAAAPAAAMPIPAAPNQPAPPVPPVPAPPASVPVAITDGPRPARPRWLGLRPGAWAMSAIGAAMVVALAVAPMDWAGVANARATQLRPELAQPQRRPASGPKPQPQAPDGNGQGTTAGQPARDAQTQDGGAGAAQGKGQKPQRKEPTVKPIAEKVPDNLDASRYAFDPATQTCAADAMLVGDSLIAGTSDAIQAALPNAYIDGVPSRQLPQIADAYSQDTASGASGSVVVFGVGTNGILESADEVQRLVDLTGGKPTYFITIRMPYPGQQDNNNEMLRQAASRNPNVGIIDWHGVSEGHDEYLGDDGIHPNMDGAYAYADMVRKAICGR